MAVGSIPVVIIFSLLFNIQKFFEDLFNKCLKPLASRFFNICLKVLSRYQVWALMCLKNFAVGPDVSLEMKRSETTKDLQKLDINSKKSLKKSVSDQQLTELEKSNSALHISLVDLINIFSDLETFLSQVPSLSTASQVLKRKFLYN